MAGTEYIVTNPSGREYVVTAPEGATQEQALEYAKSQFQSTPGGAAIGGTPQRSEARTPIDYGANEALAKIGGAGGIGTVLGAVAPEILTGLGGVAGSFPLTAPAAPALNMLGLGLKGNRLGSSILGGISGLTGETAGQIAETMGAGPVGAEAARIAGGAIGPETAQAGIWALKKYIATPALSIWSKLQKEFGRGLLDKLEKTPQGLSEQEGKYLDKLVVEMRGAKDDTPISDVYGGLSGGAQQARSQSLKDASNLLTEAENTVRSSTANAQSLQNAAEQGLQASQRQRLAIGNDSEPWQVGQVLRDRIITKNKAALDARQKQIDIDKKAVLDDVASKENAGTYVTSIPEYEVIVRNLKKELEPGKRSPDVQDTFRHILKSITTPEPKREMFMGQDIGPSTPQANVTFQAIEDVRRELGKVFEGIPAEGYKGIDAGIARKYYGMVSNLQKKFTGGDQGAQARLLENYAQGSEALAPFRSKKGSLATAVDKFNADEFKTDASALPKKYFSTKEGFDSLVELVGDKGAVVGAAKDWTTNQLRGKSADEVRSWMTTNRHLPGDVLFPAGQYADALGRGEKTLLVASQRLKGVGGETDKMRGTAISRAEETMKQGESTAQMLEGKRFPVERVTQLIERGTPQEWEVAAKAIHGNTIAKAQMNNAVRQVMGNRAYKSTRDVADFFGGIRPNLEFTGMITAKEADQINNVLERIQAMKLPEAQKIGIAKRMLMQGIGGEASSLAARGAVGAYGELGSMSQFVPQ